MNPLDMKGTEFLVFYFFFALVCVVLFRFIVRYLSPATFKNHNLVKDPYTIAFLRGEMPEVIRVAVVSLIDRGHLVVSEYNKLGTSANPEVFKSNLLEYEIIKTAQGDCRLIDLFENPNIAMFAGQYEAILEKSNLLYSGEHKKTRDNIILLGNILIIGLGGGKLLTAISRGKGNFTFLVIAIVFFTWVFRKVVYTRMTRAGEYYLDSLMNLLKDASTKIYRIRRTNSSEIPLIVSVFGVSVLPATEYPYAQTLFSRPNNRNETSNSGDSSYESSCSSSCGGGCGGGCGGCGS